VATSPNCRLLPLDGEPVTSGKWPSQDAALNVAEGIARVVEG
jgi:hypothetical protein